MEEGAMFSMAPARSRSRGGSRPENTRDDTQGPPWAPLHAAAETAALKPAAGNPAPANSRR